MESASKMKILHIKENTMPENEVMALPGFHAISGCDSTSSFHGYGKSKCFKTMQSDEIY